MIRSKQWILAAAAIAILAAAAGCKKTETAAAPAAKADPFPPSGAVQGWQKTSDTRVFAPKDLFQYIDGDAEQYIAAGIVSTSTSDYTFDGKMETTVDVHTMGDAAGARKIFETGQTKDAKIVPLGDAGIAYSQSVIFRKGPYLVRIVAYSSPPDAQQALVALAQGLESKL